MASVNKSLFSRLSSPELEQLMSSFGKIVPDITSDVQKPQAVVPNAPGVNTNADGTIGLESVNSPYEAPANPYLSPNNDVSNMALLQTSKNPYGLQDELIKGMQTETNNTEAPQSELNKLTQSIGENIGGLVGAGVEGLKDVVTGVPSAIVKGFQNSSPETSNFISDFLDRLSQGGITPSEEQIIKALKLNPYKGAQENITLNTLLENQGREQALAAKRAEENQFRIDSGRLDPKSPEFKEFNTLVDTKAQIKYLIPEINKAIQNNDVNAITLIGNQIAALASVANKQGVVNGEEVNRVLGSVQAAKQQMQAGQWNTPEGSVKLGRELWNGLNKFGELVNGGVNAKLDRYQKTYDIPDSFFKRSGVDIHDITNNSENVITPEEQDKAIARATIFDNVKRAISLGQQIPNQLLGSLNGLLGTNYDTKTNPAAINKAIEQYYKNENNLYQSKFSNTDKISQAKSLLDSGDLEGAKALLNGMNKTVKPTQEKISSLSNYDSTTKEAIKQAQAGDVNAAKYLKNKKINNWKEIK